MACFLVSAAEAAVVTVAANVIEKKENSREAEEVKTSENTTARSAGTPFSRKLKWLSNMLWGGSVLLAFEHLWHGEIVPWFPFLTAASNPASAMEMLKEMATVGVAMAALVTTVWLGMVGVSVLIERKAPGEEPQTAHADK